MAQLLASALLALVCVSSVWSASFDQLLALSDEDAMQDPILWKTQHAGQFASAAASGEKVGAAQAATELNTDNTTLLVARSGAYHLVLAVGDFGGSFNSIDEDDMTDVPYVQDFLEDVKARKSVVDTWMQYVDGVKEQDPLLVAAQEVLPSNGTGRPSNVLCTGIDGGGAFVPLCALWATFTWPNAHVTAISFGSPWPGNARFNWTMTQLVDQYYFWPGSDEGYGEGELSKQTLSDVLEILGGGVFDRLTSRDNDEVEEGVRDIIRDATTIRLYNKDGDDVTSFTEPVLLSNDTSDGDDQIEFKGEEYDVTQLNQTIEDWHAVENECPLLLCKTRLPSVLQATIYAEYDPADPEWIGPIRLPEVMPGAVLVLEAEKDADGAVAWNATTETAYFIFRGSESTRDWMTNANIIQSDFPVKSTAQDQVFKNPEVAMGFNRQFKALTQSDNPRNNFEAILKNLSGGATPKVVVCTGQSLGGALSTLCGPWAANTYPSASVLVVNEGSPKVGDKDWVFYFKAIVGHAYRFINSKDQVPLLAPLNEYQHVSRGIFIDDDKITLRDRPELKLRDSNWIDHNYYRYSIYQTNIDNVTVPDYVYNQLNPNGIDDALVASDDNGATGQLLAAMCTQVVLVLVASAYLVMS